MSSLSDTSPLVLDPSAPTLSAHEYKARRKTNMINWRGDFYVWTGTHYQIRSKDEIKRELYQFGEMAVTPTGECFKPNIRKIDEILAAVKYRTFVPERYSEKSDISTGAVLPGVSIPFQNGLLDIDSDTLMDHSDTRLVFNVLPFSYDPNVIGADTFQAFLKSLWPDDDGSDGGNIATLQEMLGYLVSGSGDLQKIFLLVGPPRSGKGTIAWLIQQLVGAENYAGVKFSQLTGQFGLAVIIGKTVMAIPDARSYSRDAGAATEVLLTISGQDEIAVPRKNTGDWTGVLPARVVIMSNEVPRLHDTGGAVPTRFLPIVMNKSFVGQEDTGLKDKLQTELPAILNWALDGARRLFARGRFIMPEVAQETVDDLSDLANPVQAFVRERLIWADPEAAELSKAALYSAYRMWCGDNGHTAAASHHFGMRLRQVVPSLVETKPHGQPRRWRGIALRRPEDRCPAIFDGRNPWCEPGGVARMDQKSASIAATFNSVNSIMD